MIPQNNKNEKAFSEINIQFINAIWELKILIIPIVLIVIICAVCIIKVVIDSGSPVKQAVKLVNADYGKDIDISAIYYNEEQKGCIVEFTSNRIEDVACVHLEEKLVGYESEYEALVEKMDTAYSDEDKQKYALQIIEYPYDALWVYNLYMYGTIGLCVNPLG